jgi:hypothetical protein
MVISVRQLSWVDWPGQISADGKIGSPMQQIPVKLSLEEIRALLEMVENQLFRMKFIDSKMPGHKANPEKQRVVVLGCQ